MSTVLELKNVSKIMNGKALVEDISFTVNKGEIFGFLGPNGAGKTTTIKMITGLYSILSELGSMIFVPKSSEAVLMSDENSFIFLM